MQEIVRLYVMLFKIFSKKENALIILNVRISVTFTYCQGKENTVYVDNNLDNLH